MWAWPWLTPSQSLRPRGEIWRRGARDSTLGARMEDRASTLGARMEDRGSTLGARMEDRGFTLGARMEDRASTLGKTPTPPLVLDSKVVQ